MSRESVERSGCSGKTSGTHTDRSYSGCCLIVGSAHYKDNVIGEMFGARTGQREAFAAAEGDRACAVAERLTRKGWPLAANPWRALRKCNVGCV